MTGTPRDQREGTTSQDDETAERARNSLARVIRGEADTLAAWIDYGRALNELRTRHATDIAFGRAVKAHALDTFPTPSTVEDLNGGEPLPPGKVHPAERSAAMWAAANPDELEAARKANPRARTPRKLHADHRREEKRKERNARARMIRAAEREWRERGGDDNATGRTDEERAAIHAQLDAAEAIIQDAHKRSRKAREERERLLELLAREEAERQAAAGIDPEEEAERVADEYERNVDRLERELAERDATIAERDATITELRATIAERDRTIANLKTRNRATGGTGKGTTKH